MVSALQENKALMRELSRKASNMREQHQAAGFIQFVWRQTRMRSKFGFFIDRIRVQQRLDAIAQRNKQRWRWQDAMAAAQVQFCPPGVFFAYLVPREQGVAIVSLDCLQPDASRA